MENKNIIIIMLVIIAILAVVAGSMFLQINNAKEPATVKITSNKTLYEGEDVTLKLTNLNKTPLSKEKVKITVKNSKGKVVANKTVKTNDKGNAKMDLDLKKGKYNVTVVYSGNDNFTGSNATQKLNIKEEVTESADTSLSGNSYVDGILNDPSCTVVKDPYSICPKHGVPYWQDNVCDWFINP